MRVDLDALSPNGALLECIIGLAIFVFLLALGRWLKRQQGVKLGLIYMLFTLCVAAYIPLHTLIPEPAQKDLVMRNLRAGIVIFGTLVTLSIFHRFFWELWFERHHGSRAPMFLSQVVGLVLFLAAVFVALGHRDIYGLSIQGAVLGSTVVVGIIGFAMQDLLGNVIAGISIEIGKPFRVGDWLVVDRKRVEVMEVNWRSTRCRDNDHVYYDIPNRHIVGSTITNLTYPDSVHGVRIEVRFEYSVPPNAIKDRLKHATLAAKGVLQTPEPRIFLLNFGQSGVIYQVRFWIGDGSLYNQICDAVRTNIWYEAQRSGMAIPFPIRTLQIQRKKNDNRNALEVARTSLRRQPFLQLLSSAQLDRILADARLLRFGRGERVIEQGDEGRSMFILVQGQADVFVQVGDEEKHVATLRDGEYCGEMSLLTGDVRAATVQARTDCEMWEIGKETLADILAENTMLLDKLSEILAKRKMEVDGIIEASLADDEKEETVSRYKEGFLRRLYSFFEL